MAEKAMLPVLENVVFELEIESGGLVKTSNDKADSWQIDKKIISDIKVKAIVRLSQLSLG